MNNYIERTDIIISKLKNSVYITLSVW